MALDNNKLISVMNSQNALSMYMMHLKYYDIALKILRHNEL